MSAPRQQNSSYKEKALQQIRNSLQPFATTESVSSSSNYSAFSSSHSSSNYSCITNNTNGNNSNCNSLPNGNCNSLDFRRTPPSSSPSRQSPRALEYRAKQYPFVPSQLPVYVQNLCRQINTPSLPSSKSNSPTSQLNGGTGNGNNGYINSNGGSITPSASIVNPKPTLVIKSTAVTKPVLQTAIPFSLPPPLPPKPKLKSRESPVSPPGKIELPVKNKSPPLPPQYYSPVNQQQQQLSSSQQQAQPQQPQPQVVGSASIQHQQQQQQYQQVTPPPSSSILHPQQQYLSGPQTGIPQPQQPGPQQLMQQQQSQHQFHSLPSQNTVIHPPQQFLSQPPTNNIHQQYLQQQYGFQQQPPPPTNHHAPPPPPPHVPPHHSLPVNKIQSSPQPQQVIPVQSQLKPVLNNSRTSPPVHQQHPPPPPPPSSSSKLGKLVMGTNLTSDAKNYENSSVTSQGSGGDSPPPPPSSQPNKTSSNNNNSNNNKNHPPPPLAESNSLHNNANNNKNNSNNTAPTAAPPAPKTKHESPIPERKKLSKEKEEERSDSRVRVYSPQAFKFFMEQHVENVIKSHKERLGRRMQLEREMAKLGLSEEAQTQMRKMLSQKESNYIRLNRAKMDKSMFNVIKTIGVGAFGEVALVRKKGTQHLFAMKTLRKSDVLRRNQVAHVKAERDILAEADNEWVVKLYYSFQDRDNLYFVMDYIPGGDLMSLLIKKEIFDEPLACFYIAELTCAIESVHAMGFIHRDIKPDNILIGRDGHIKLTDFGLCTGFRWTHNSKYYQESKNCDCEQNCQWEICMGSARNNNNICGGTTTTSSSHNKPLERRRNIKGDRCLAHSLVGTPNYIAPEVLTRIGYTQLCDWWSVGVILYEMLVGQPPFLAQTPAETQYKVINWATTLRIPPQAHLSPEAQDLILKFCTDQSLRLGKHGPEEIKAHPFFRTVDFESGLRRATAPFVPEIRHPTDTSNFDPCDEERPNDLDTNPFGTNQFHGFYEFTFRRFFDDAYNEDAGPVYV